MSQKSRRMAIRRLSDFILSVKPPAPVARSVDIEQ
jgi:hypothetical protein